MGSARRVGAGRRRRAIALKDRDFIRGAAAWAAKTDVSTVAVGFSREEARLRADQLIRSLRRGEARSFDEMLTESEIDVLRAACELLTERFAGSESEPPVLQNVDPEGLLGDAERLYNFASNARWPEPDFDERTEVLADSAILGWRIARREAKPPQIEEWQSRSVAAAFAKPPATAVANGMHIANARLLEFRNFPLPSPCTLLPLLAFLRQQWETAPARVLEEATFIYNRLEELKAADRLGRFLLDESEHFLGETARIAAAVCRQLSRRESVRQWLALAEGWFVHTKNSSGDLAKVSYQRLTLQAEERDFAAVRRLLPQLVSTFERLGMREDALKSRLLDGLVLKETGEFAEAALVLNEIVREAESLKLETLQAWAYVNLVQTYGHLGDAEIAIRKTKEAAPILLRVGNRIGLAKLQWGIGTLLRSQGDPRQAVEAYRSAEQQFSEIGMRADVAAVHLVIADLLLDAGQEKQAEWEICQALPLIDEYKLVPEGFAAMTLLRESLRRQKIDRQALRNLHEHFEQSRR